MELNIGYETTYRYAREVGFSPHEIRLFPRPDRFSYLQSFEFKTSPQSHVRFSRDEFDNVVAACFFSERSAELRIELALELALERKNPFDFILDGNAVETPFTYEPASAEVLATYRKPKTSEPLILPGWEKPTMENRRGTVNALVGLNRALFEQIAYERREEGSAFAPEETLRARRGACRDVAVLLAEILRQSGFAARLASGYLLESDSEIRRAEGSLHAWTEVFLPGAGWIGMDPTNGSFCNHNFIVAAVGLTPADITPISGSYYNGEPVAAKMASRLEFFR